MFDCCNWRLYDVKTSISTNSDGFTKNITIVLLNTVIPIFVIVKLPKVTVSAMFTVVALGPVTC